MPGSETPTDVRWLWVSAIALSTAAGPGDEDDDDDDAGLGGGGSGGNIDPDDDEGYDEDDDDEDEEPLQVSPLRIGRWWRPPRSAGGGTICTASHQTMVQSSDAASCEFRRLPAACGTRPRQPDHRFLISRFILPAVRV
jgi:hypothetical protein